MPLCLDFAVAAQVCDTPMLDQNQRQLRQQHANEDHHAGGLEQQDADDRASVEQHRPCHRQDEHLIHVQQCTLAIQNRLNGDQYRAYAEYDLAGGNLSVRPAGRQHVQNPIACNDGDGTHSCAHEHDPPIEPAADGFKQGFGLAA